MVQASAALPTRDVPSPPTAKRIPVVIARVHGTEVVNDYEWMRDLDDPEVLTYLEAENAYSDKVMAHLVPLRDRLVTEAAARATGGPAETVAERGGYVFERAGGHGRYPVIRRRRVADPEGPGEVVLDLDAVAGDRPFLQLDALEPSDDGESLAYSVDLLGNERYTLTVVDLRTGATPVPGLRNAESVTWAADGTHLFYVEVAEAPWRGARLFRVHVPTGQRTLVYEEPDRELYLAARRSGSGAYVFVDVLQKWSHGPVSAVEVHAIRADRPGEPPRLLISRTARREVRVEHGDDRFYLRVDDEGPECRLVTTPEDSVEPRHWQELLPLRSGVALDDLFVFRDHAVVMEWQDALRHARVVVRRTGASHRIPIDEVAWSMEPIDPRGRFDTTVFRFAYSSFVTPRTVVDHDIATGRSSMVSQAPVPGFDPSRYEVLKIGAPAKDGATIPVVLVRRRGPVPVGGEPVLLHGYGCYGNAQSATFDAARISLLDRGVAYAIAHVRGGGEGGRRWHDAGRRMAKRTTWDDFVSVAEHLIAEGHVAKDGIVISGRSAGGTLVTAAANLRPDLFRGVVALVPFADPLHVQLDETMPFTVHERAEWGDPLRSAAEFDYLRGHCPFTNLEPRDYPPMYVTASLHDGEVPYWQPAKHVAKSRQMRTDRSPLVFRTNFHAGHSGSSDPAEAARERAEIHAFVLDQLGRAGKPGP